MDRNVKPNKSLRFRWQHDIKGTILYDIKELKAYRLNKTAYEIWELSNGSNSLDEIIEEISRRYRDIDKTIIEQDITHLMDYMLSKKMIFLEELA